MYKGYNDHGNVDKKGKVQIDDIKKVVMFTH